MGEIIRDFSEHSEIEKMDQLDTLNFTWANEQHHSFFFLLLATGGFFEMDHLTGGFFVDRWIFAKDSSFWKKRPCIQGENGTVASSPAGPKILKVLCQYCNSMHTPALRKRFWAVNQMQTSVWEHIGFSRGSKWPVDFFVFGDLTGGLNGKSTGRTGRKKNYAIDIGDHAVWEAGIW